MLVDYHMHTALCYHAYGEMEEYIEEAIGKGITEVGFSEHSPWMIQMPKEKLAPSYSEMKLFIERTKELQKRYNRRGSPITVRLGIEADFVPE